MKNIASNNTAFDIVKAGSEKPFIRRALQQAMQQNASAALWRLPGERTIRLLINISGIEKLSDHSYEEREPGFMMASYQGDDYYLKADLFWDDDSNRIAIRESLKNRDKVVEFIENIHGQETDSPLSLHVVDSSSIPIDKEGYISLVQKAVEGIEKGLFQKVVPARCTKRPVADGDTILKAFFNLAESYPNAFVSLVSSPDTGTWLGASPELLVSTE
ncbi:MAG: chorismate-binding protein, partial [Cyclobacteriaceae bacterium]|nr:chorismate-binding protein [Cyclobacteriaceae bacterium]